MRPATLAHPGGGACQASDLESTFASSGRAPAGELRPSRVQIAAAAGMASRPCSPDRDEHLPEVGTVTLPEKLEALRRIGATCFLPAGHLAAAEAKTRRGHREHHDADTVDLHDELRQELADLAGYGALMRLRGLWTWRLWVIVCLAGLQWRLLGRIR